MEKALFPGPRIFDGNDQVLLHGTITIDSDGTVASQDVPGANGTSAARTAEGVYALYLDDTYAGGCKGCILNVNGAFHAELTTDSSTSTSAPLLVINTTAGADKTTDADADSCVIQIIAILQRRA